MSHTLSAGRLARRLGFAGLCVAACLGTSASAPAADRLVWIGASAGNPRFDGIYAARFDEAAGTLSPPARVVEVLNPCCLEMHPKLPVLYAAAAVTAGGRIDSFAIDEAAGGLESRGSVAGFQNGSLAVDPAGKRLFAAARRQVACFPLADDGLPQPAAKNNGQVRHELDNAAREARKKQAGTNPSRQNEPAEMGISSTPDGRFVIAADLSLDKLFVDAADAAQATVLAHNATELPTGVGPRRFAWHPNGRVGYALNELDCSVTALAFDPDAGTLTVLDTVSTLPEDADEWDRKRGVEQRTFAMDIAVHPSGKFLHVANAGHDSVATLAIDAATGRPKFLAAQKTKGKQPVAIALAPGGRHLLVATQRSGGVEVMAVDPQAGRLAATAARAEITAPACLRFR